MGRLKSNKTETIVGLDIGSYSIKSVEVIRTDAGIELHRAVVLPVQRDEDLKQILQQMKLSPASRVRAALSGPSIIIRRISMPLLSSRELQSAIRFEAESHIPFSIEDCILDYQVLSQDSAKKEMSILLVAAKRDLVEARYKLLSEAGIYPELMDLDIFCLVNAFEVLSPGEREKSFGLLNIGHRVSSFAIIHEGLPSFVREISMGGFQVTEALMSAKGCTEAQADEIKMKKPAEETEVLKSATRKGFEPLFEEIRHSIDYVENEIKDELKMLYISGGGALATGVSDFLTEDIGRPVLFWDNTQKMQLLKNVDDQFMKDHSMELNVALGMTLRELGASRK